MYSVETIVNNSVFILKFAKRIDLVFSPEKKKKKHNETKHNYVR